MTATITYTNDLTLPLASRGTIVEKQRRARKKRRRQAPMISAIAVPIFGSGG